MATQDVTDPYTECLADEVIASESDASAEPEPTVEESVPEPVPEPEPTVEESVPEPEPTVEESIPEPEPTVEESVTEPESATDESVLYAIAAKPICTVPFIYVATSEPHDAYWRFRNCICTII